MISLYEKFEKYVPIEDCLKKRINNDFLIVMNEETDIYYLNDTARFIYENIDGKASVNDIFLQIKKEYDLEGVDDAIVKKDLVELIRDFQWQGIIRLKEVN